MVRQLDEVVDRCGTGVQIETSTSGSFVQAVGAVSTVLRTPMADKETIDRLVADALAALSEHIGAARSCLCIADPSAGLVSRFVTGGTEDLSALGPQLVGSRLADVPEWNVQRARETPFTALALDELSPQLRDALVVTEAEWIVTTPLIDEWRRSTGSLSVLGRGDTHDIVRSRLEAVEIVADLLAVALSRMAGTASSPEADRWSRVALDLIDEGVMLLDHDGRVRMMNRTTERQLGCALADLDPLVPLWDQIDAQIGDGVPVKDVATSNTSFRDLDLFGPVAMRIVGRQGLITRGDLTVRSIVGGDPSKPMMLAVFQPAKAQEKRVLSSLDELLDVTGPDDTAQRMAGIPGLTAREQQILFLLLHGHRVPKIAERLFLSPHTVRNHLKVIFRKTGVNSQIDLIEFARAR